MEERIWNNEFLARCEWPREIVVDNMRLRITDAEHAAYWDEHGKKIRLADTDERHNMELNLLPIMNTADSFDKITGDGKIDDNNTGNGDVGFNELKRSEKMEHVATETSVETLGVWLMACTDSQVKGAIKARLAELG